jgi:hypothetical protein
MDRIYVDTPDFVNRHPKSMKRHDFIEFQKNLRHPFSQNHNRYVIDILLYNTSLHFLTRSQENPL